MVSALELPNNQVQTPINMSGNFLLYHFNNASAFNDNGTNVYDYSGSGNNGTTINFDGDEITNGEYGKAFNYSVNDYVNTSKLFSLYASGTIVAWINFSGWQSTTDYAIVSNYDGGAFSNGEFLIYLNNDKDLEALMSTSGIVQTNYSSGGYVDGQFHHVAVTWASNNLRLYIDGVLKSTDTTFTNSIFGFTKYVLIARDNDGAASPTANRPFNGSIDDVAFWNRTLSGTEIATIVEADTYSPIVYLENPDNASVYVYNTNETFSANLTDNLSNIGEANLYTNFRNQVWKLEQSNTTDSSSLSAIYNFSINFYTTWFDSENTITNANLSNPTGRALSGNATYFFMTSYQDDRIKWFLRNGTYIQNFTLPTSWIADLTNNGTDMYMIDLLQANPVRHTYFNGTVIDSCAITGSGSGSLQGIAFDSDLTTLWVSYDAAAELLMHIYPNCTNIENITLPDSNPVNLEIHGDSAYVHDGLTTDDQIMIINLTDGSNPYNITGLRFLMGQSIDQMRGLWIDRDDTLVEKLYITGNNPPELTYIQRRLSGNMTWNVQGCDIYNNCVFNSTNYTYYFSSPCWTYNSGTKLLFIPDQCLYFKSIGEVIFL